MRWWPIFMISGSKETATVVIGIHPTKAWLLQLVNIKNAVWLFRSTIRNKILFQTWKNDTETYGMLQTAFGPSGMNRASVFELQKRFNKGRESLRDDERCGRSKEVNTSELIGQRLGLGLGLLCWVFKGVQEEIPSEETSTRQIASVVFPAGQFTRPQLHPCHRLFDQDGHQDSSSASLQSRPCFLWLLVIP